MIAPQVVILCGGRGTRLREETEFRPKPMVEIGGKPILWHIMKIYAHFGYKDFVLCLGYKGEIIKQYFLNYAAMNSDFSIELGSHNRIDFHHRHTEDGWKVTLADTGDSAMTGSRVKQIEKYIQGDTFMLTYGDGIANVDMNKLLNFHCQHGKVGTVTGIRPYSRFGELHVDEDSVRKFGEKPLLSHGYASGGFFVFQRKFFDYLRADYECVMEGDGLESLARDGQLMMHSHDGFWQSVDTYRDYLYIQDLWHKKEAHWKVWED